MSNKNVIVIGSGVGGSAVGALLAHKGHNVTLIEKSSLIGGRFAGYHKDGFHVDIGCHMLANCEKGALGKVLDICGHPEYVTWGYARKPSPVINYKGESVKFPFEAHKLGFSKQDLEDFMRFHEAIQKMTPEECSQHDDISIKDFVAKFVSNELARSIVGFFAAIYFVARDDEVPVGEYALCQNQIYEKKALGYPEGGTVAVPEAYCRIIEECGGTIKKNTAVKCIIVEDNEAKGVELEDGTRLEADIIISNSAVKDTVLNLIGKDCYPEDFINKINAYRYSFGTHTIAIALDKPISDQTMVFYIGHDNLMEVEKEIEDGGTLPDSAPHLMIPIVSNIDTKSAPPGKQLIIAGGSCKRPYTDPKETFDKWDKAIMNSVRAVFPGIDEHILWTVSTSTQKMHNMYGEEGSVIGIAQILGQVGEDRPPIIDPYIKNMYHCSADTGLHGIGGELAADAAIRLYEHLT